MRDGVGPVLLLAAAVAFPVAFPAAVAAQECRGVPARVVHAYVDTRQLSNGQSALGAEAGVAIDGRLGLRGNFSSSQIGRPGSKTVSFGGGVWRQMSNGWLSACFTTGYQRGRAYLVNVDDSGTNFRARFGRLSAGAAAAVTLRPVESVRLIAFVFPEISLQHEKYDQYDRDSWITGDQSAYPSAWTFGASVAVSRFFVRLARTSSSDTKAVVLLGGGIAW